MVNLQSLRRRAERVFGTSEADAALKRVRAIIGTTNLPVGFEGDLAKTALAKLKDSSAEEPTPRELAALEMMLRMMRPAPKFEEGKLEELTEPEFAQAFPNWKAFQETLTPLKAGIGRIETAAKEPAGTGFLVGDEILVTNRHVLDLISRGTRKLEPGQARIGFHYEVRPRGAEDPVPIQQVIAFHEQFDIALLRVNRAGGRRPALKIANLGPKLEQAVVTIGHPFDDPVNNPLFTRTIFGGSWGIKRAAPGEVIAEMPFMIGHDCSTLGGNSGSPLVSMESAEVIGLHFGGGFLWRNEAIICTELSKFVNANA
jgi:S1-C subfamily serine protease